MLRSWVLGITLGLANLGLSCHLCAEADAAKGADDPPAQEQFDFWVGEWETEMSNFPNWDRKTGRDIVTKHLGGKLIEEVFYKGPQGENFQRGYLFYLARDEKWQHIIYDQKWGEFCLMGGFQDGKMVLESPAHDTRPGKRRETFSNIKPDSFDYQWEESYDGGKTWQVFWKVAYQRKPADAAN